MKRSWPQEALRALGRCCAMSAIGTKQTSILTLNMSAFGGKRTSLIRSLMSANDPKRTFVLHGGEHNRGQWLGFASAWSTPDLVTPSISLAMSSSRMFHR